MASTEVTIMTMKSNAQSCRKEQWPLFIIINRNAKENAVDAISLENNYNMAQLYVLKPCKLAAAYSNS